MGAEESPDNANWATLWADATPSAEDTWENLAAHSAVSTTSGTKYIFFGARGRIVALEDAYVMIEGLTATVGFNSSNIPSGSFLGETSSYNLDITLENQTTGDSLTLQYPMQTNKVLNMDGENFDITYDDVSLIDVLQLDDDSRDIWIRLAQGSNTLGITSPDVGTLDIELSWYRRRL